VHPSVPVKSVDDLIALARSRPGQLTFSSSGNGGTGHLSGEQFAALAKIKLVHVPYRGTGPATVAILSGEISFGFANLVAIAPFVQSNRLRPIAVTSRKRLQASPEIPTVAESGLSAYEYVTWYGVLTTNGTNKDIVNKLNHEIVKISNSSDMKMKLTSEGGEAVSSTPLEFQNYIKSELIEAQKIVKLSRIKLQK
jgi:tripartite-type tricarboxylate transporter receptor subunit TctC